jgi:ParB family transcriptional regulator, chromosome partitioning protein
MARKNLFPTRDASEKLAAANSGTTMAVTKPGLAFADRGAMGGFARGLDRLTQQVNQVKEIEAKLTAGQVVVELDPGVIDGSFIVDRMSQEDEAFRALRNAIEERGQESPILVRPHPEVAGRYQIAFGHRRHAIAKALGRNVRGVIRALSDEELVVAQGQENSARADLSFIERARFAHAIQEHGYARALIMAALSVDKTEVSKMRSVTERIPLKIIDAIGAAPSVGRRRWLELADQFQPGMELGALEALITSAEFQVATSEERFDMMAGQWLAANATAATSPRSVNNPNGKGPRREVRIWGPADKERLVKATENKRSYNLSIDQETAPGFGDFLMSEMPRLFGEYRNSRK